MSFKKHLRTCWDLFLSSTHVWDPLSKTAPCSTAWRQMRGIFSAPSMAQYVHSFHPSTPSADASEAKRELGCESRAGCFHASMRQAWCQIQYVCKHRGMPNLVTVGQKWSHLYEGKACSTSLSTVNSVFGGTQCIYGLVYTCWYLILSSSAKKKQPCNLLRTFFFFKRRKIHRQLVSWRAIWLSSFHRSWNNPQVPLVWATENRIYLSLSLYPPGN